MNSKELRSKREEFRLKNNHQHLSEVSLLASKESTAMFNVAGMQQLIPYLAGKPHPLGKKLYNIQRCLRTNDIDEVGDNSHLTVFEMMGNWSLGDYFKKESVKYSYQFLVEELGFDPKKLAVTVFEGNQDAPRDDETAQYWKELGFPENKIAFMGAKDNWRSPGPVGPCGPDTEIFYRVGETEFPPTNSNPKIDEDNWLEVWNNVFMEYYRDESGHLTKLENQNVDTGMGFERMCTVLQQKESVFETDLFLPIIQNIEKFTGLDYLQNKRRFRIIADHFRSAIILLHDGAIISNVGAGYVLRMIIRRMYYNLILLKDLSDEDLNNLISDTVDFVSNVWNLQKTSVSKALLAEISIFKHTIDRGIKILQDKLGKLAENSILSGADIFFLYDTCGFPLELTKEICAEKNIQIDEKGFQKEMEIQKEKSRQSAKFQKDVDWSKYLEGISPTKFIAYDISKPISAEITLLKDFIVNEQRVLIFDQTPFYAESGGQKGDSGWIQLDSGEKLKIKDVQKYDGVFLHLVE